MNWISCGDRMPDDGSYVLVFRRYDSRNYETRVQIAQYCDDVWWYGDESTEDSENISYWMPLPKAPA